jgi:hypothetical protein
MQGLDSILAEEGENSTCGTTKTMHETSLKYIILAVETGENMKSYFPSFVFV